MTNLVIEITVPVATDDVIEQASVIAPLQAALASLKGGLPEGSTHTSRLVKEQAGKPRGRKPKAAANGAEARQQPSA